jgi:hypothetical protein
MDDGDARREAEKMTCAVLGTRRVLWDAGVDGGAELKIALDRLRLTNFRVDSSARAPTTKSAQPPSPLEA